MSARETSPAAQFAAMLSRFPPNVVALAKRSMPKICRALPGAHQVVYDYSHSLVVSFSMSGRGYEGIISVAILRDGVRLYFDKSLPDPKGLLQGAGSKVRSVELKDAAHLDKGDIKELVKAAVKHSGATIPRTGANPMIIQTDSKKRTPARKSASKSASKSTKSRKPARKKA